MRPNNRDKNFALRLALKERLRELGNGLLQIITKEKKKEKHADEVACFPFHCFSQLTAVN